MSPRPSPSARSLLAMFFLGCSVHEHELTPYEKDVRGGAGGSTGAAGNAPAGSAGTGAGGMLMDVTDWPETDVDASIADSAHPTDALSGDPASEDGRTCLPDCPPTACGTISNNCGATLACGPCRLSSTFHPVADVMLATPRYAAAVVRIGNYVYVIGGYRNGTFLSSIERAIIDNNGNLSNFSDVGVTLVLGRSGHTAFFINQQLYVIGGASISYTSTVERAAVDGNGNLGAFATVAGVTLTTPRGAHGTTVIGHTHYVIGGTESAALDSLESATFSSSGDLSTFTPVTNVALSTKRLGFGSATVGGWLYLIGGATDIDTDAGTSLGYLNSLERAPLDASGFTGTFGALTSLSLAIPRYKLAAFAFGSHLYAIGGTNDISGALASVEQGTIDAQGDLIGPFAVSSTIALAEPRAGAVFLVAQPWLYAIGGHSGAGDLRTVERASLE